MDEFASDPDWDIFISYARHDVEQAMALADLLRTHDLRVFLDESGVRACTSIPKAIRQALSSSRLLIALYSHTYPTRPACMWELDAALRNGLHEKDPHRRVLVINPEKDSSHIHIPVLHDSRHWKAPTSSSDDSGLLLEVMEHLSNLSDSMGLPPSSCGSDVPTAGFTGRFPQLWELYDKVSPPIKVLGIEPHPRGAQVIGLPGVGKSAFINAYTVEWGAFYESRTHRYRESLPDTWHEGLTIVEDLSPCQEGQIHDWLNRRPTNSAVIVSSRVPLDVPLPVFRIGSLEVEGASALLRSYRQPRSEAEDKAAHKLASQVGGHP